MNIPFQFTIRMNSENSTVSLDILRELFFKWSGIEPDALIPIKGSGSNRQYFRISAGKMKAVGVYNPLIAENKAYFRLTQQFGSYGLNVPQLFEIHSDNQHYLIQFIGSQDFLSVIESILNTAPFDKQLIIKQYSRVLEDLIQFQVTAGQDMDYSVCYPVSEFTFDNYLNDLLYFRYYFLNLSGIAYSEEKLLNDFRSLSHFLMKADAAFFSYRDFQARNILLHDTSKELFYIDFQGGRKGPLQYDLASLLFQAKAQLTPEIRLELLDIYIDKLSKVINVDRDQFVKYFRGFVLVRILQTLGAYGLRGLIEKKTHFLNSIPLALNNIKWFTDHIKLEPDLPELTMVLTQLPNPSLNKIIQSMSLKINLFSFSYKKTMPEDESGNGGGFLFDCRCLPNPGRLEQYRNLTGKDLEVVQYLENEPTVHQFIDHSYALIKLAVDNYIERGFTSLSIGFGCTGGQHRSVYCSEKIYKKLKQDYMISVQLSHHCIN